MAEDPPEAGGIGHFCVVHPGVGGTSVQHRPACPRAARRRALQYRRRRTARDGRQGCRGRGGGQRDGAHKIIADMFQGLNDIGYSIPAQGGTYWNGEAMQTKDYKDLDEVPEPVAKTTAAAARNAVHLAGLLRGQDYPSYQ